MYVYRYRTSWDKARCLNSVVKYTPTITYSMYVHPAASTEWRWLRVGGSGTMELLYTAFLGKWFSSIEEVYSHG